MKTLSYLLLILVASLTACKKNNTELQSEQKPDVINIQANLLKMDPNVSPAAMGILTGTLDLKTNILKFKLTLENIDANIVHIHRGIFPDKGLIEASFSIPNSHILNDRLLLSQEDASTLAHGGFLLYMDIHISQEEPPQIGGQIVKKD